MSIPKKEIRSLKLEEVRAEAFDQSLKIGGYAAVFNKFSEDLGGFKEKISRGAFANTIAVGDIRALWNHDMGTILGRTKSGTLKLSEDDYGLRFDLDLPNTSVGNHVYEVIKRGDVTGVSFGFFVNKETWDFNQEPAIRTIHDIELIEVSPVIWPAYTQTSVNVRSATEILELNKPKLDFSDKIKESELRLQKKLRPDLAWTQK